MSVIEYQASDVLRQYGKSFYFASRLLTPSFRSRSAQLYKFCRCVDDLVDESHDLSQATLKLKLIRDSLHCNKALIPEAQPIINLNFQFGLPLEPILSLLDGVESDIRMTQIPDEASLIQYAYSVAGTVGLLMCSVLDVKDKRAYPFAIDLGIAMQLTNIARDVGEDAQKNRIYLPATWVGALKANQVLSPNTQQALAIERGVKKLLSLADDYYKSGLSGLAFLPPDARKSILIAAKIYAYIGSEIQAFEYRSWLSRAYVSTPKKCWVAMRSIVSNTVRNVMVKKPMPLHNAQLHGHLKGFMGCSNYTPSTSPPAHHPPTQLMY